MVSALLRLSVEAAWHVHYKADWAIKPQLYQSILYAGTHVSTRKTTYGLPTSGTTEYKNPYQYKFALFPLSHTFSFLKLQ